MPKLKRSFHQSSLLRSCSRPRDESLCTPKMDPNIIALEGTDDTAENGGAGLKTPVVISAQLIKDERFLLVQKVKSELTRQQLTHLELLLDCLELGKV